MNGIRAETIQDVLLREDKRASAFLRDSRFESDAPTRFGNSRGHALTALAFEFQDGVLFLSAQPIGRSVEFGTRDECPRFREVVNRGQHDVEREHEQERIEIPDVIDIEPPERAVEQLLGRRQLGVISLKAFNRLLLDKHADHRCDDEQDEKHDAEADGTE